MIKYDILYPSLHNTGKIRNCVVKNVSTFLQHNFNNVIVQGFCIERNELLRRIERKGIITAHWSVQWGKNMHNLLPEYEKDEKGDGQPFLR